MRSTRSERSVVVCKRLDGLNARMLECLPIRLGLGLRCAWFVRDGD